MTFNTDFDPEDFTVTSNAGDANVDIKDVVIKINGKLVKALRFKLDTSVGISRSDGIKYAASNSMVVSGSLPVAIIKKLDAAVFGQYERAGFFMRDGERVEYDPESRHKVFSSQDPEKNDELFMIKFHDEVPANVVHKILVLEDGKKEMLYLNKDEELVPAIFKQYLKSQETAQKRNPRCNYINQVYGNGKGKITKFEDIAPEKRYNLHDGQSFYEAVKALSFDEITFGLSKLMVAKESEKQLCMSFYFRDGIARPKSSGGIEDLLNRADEYLADTPKIDDEDDFDE
jgi:archaellin